MENQPSQAAKNIVDLIKGDYISHEGYDYIVVILGAAASGKSTFAAYLKAEFVAQSHNIHIGLQSADDDVFTHEGVTDLLDSHDRTGGVLIIEGSPAIGFLNDIKPNLIIWIDCNDEVRAKLYHTGEEGREWYNFANTAKYAERDKKIVSAYVLKNDAYLLSFDNTGSRSRYVASKNEYQDPKQMQIAVTPQGKEIVAIITNDLKARATTEIYGSLSVADREDLAQKCNAITVINEDCLEYAKHTLKVTKTAGSNALAISKDLRSPFFKFSNQVKVIGDEASAITEPAATKLQAIIRKYEADIEAEKQAKIAAAEKIKTDLFNRWISAGLLPESFGVFYGKDDASLNRVLSEREAENILKAEEEDRKHKEQQAELAQAKADKEEAEARMAEMQRKIDAMEKAEDERQAQAAQAAELKRIAEETAIRTNNPELAYALGLDEWLESIEQAEAETPPTYEAVAIAEPPVPIVTNNEAAAYGITAIVSEPQPETEIQYTQYSVFVPLGSESIFLRFCEFHKFVANQID